MSAVGYCPQVAYIRRLQRGKGDDRAGPAPLLVTLTTPGERSKLYHSIDRAVKSGAQLGFSVTSEIPKYAISSYKFMGRVATVIRSQFPELKTRVNIPRGDTWPTVSIKHEDDNKFVKADQQMIDQAKMELAKANKEKPTKGKKPEVEPSTSDEPMEVGAASGRPQRQKKPRT